MRTLFSLLSIALCFSASAQQDVKPIWPIASPEEAGLSSAELNKLFDYVNEHQTRVHSIQIIRHGKLIMDSYFYPFNASSKHDVASVTKSITSTLTGIAIDHKLIPDVKGYVLPYFKEYDIKSDELKQNITMEDLLTMRSGFDCGTDLSDPKINVDQRLIEIRRSDDWIKYILKLPMRAEPGLQFAYCNGNCHLMSAIVSKSAKTTMKQFADQQLFGPLDIKNAYWPADPKGINYGWSDLQLHPYDMLKIGQLMLQQGKWNGKQIVSTEWLANATKEHVFVTGGKDHYGYFWWVPGGNHPDVFEAVGRGGQRITVWPSNDMVIVFTGGGFETSELIPFIVNAIKSDNAIEGNQEAESLFKQNIIDITKPPVPSLAKPLPPLANVVSGKNYKLSPNSLDLTSLQLIFDKREEAMMNLAWAKQKVTCIMGLDGLERFSYNAIIKLQQASIGEWLDDHTLEIKLDLVGGINFYTIKIIFSSDGKNVDLLLKEGTGLNNESFKGELSK